MGKDADMREIAQVLEADKRRIAQLTGANRQLTVENGELRTRAQRLERVEAELARTREQLEAATARADQADVARRGLVSQLATAQAARAKAEAVAAAVEEREQAAGRVAELIGGTR